MSHRTNHWSVNLNQHNDGCLVRKSVYHGLENRLLSEYDVIDRSIYCVVYLRY